MTKFIVGLALFALLLVSGLLVGFQSPYFRDWRRVTVQPGQTLWGICEQFCPSSDTRDVIAAVCQRNHIDGDILQPGQVLWVPTAS